MRQLIGTVSRQSRDISDLRGQLAGLIALVGSVACDSSGVLPSTAPSEAVHSNTDTVMSRSRVELTTALLRQFKAALESFVWKCEGNDPYVSACAHPSGEDRGAETLTHAPERRPSHSRSRKMLSQGCSTVVMYMQKIVNSPKVSR